MKRYIFIQLLTLLILIGFKSTAQMSISWPVDNTVFQRGGSNSFYVAGQCLVTNASYSLQYRVKQLNLQTGFETGTINQDWTTFASTRPYGGIFRVQIWVSPGMYTVDIRAINGTTQYASGSVIVGLGDVFIISGQSNAQGVVNTSLAEAPWKCVVSDTRKETCESKLPPFPAIYPIYQDAYVGMNGLTNWCYTRLGNKIAQNKQVPVAFFNAAMETTGLRNWIDGINNVATQSTYGAWICSGQAGQPYKSFKNALNYYGSMFGTRGVLWHQGENDAHDQWAGLTTNAQYQSRLNTVISTARNDYNTNLQWYIARVSRNNETSGSFQPTNSQIVQAQNSVAASHRRGPRTDAIQTTRPADGVHFSGTGLQDLGDAWYALLDSVTYWTAPSIQANPVPQITASASGSNVTLTAPAGYNIYRWMNDATKRFDDVPYATTQSITVSSGGPYRCYMAYTGNKNVVVSAKIYVPLPAGTFRLSAEEAYEEVNFESMLTIGPNPVDSHTNIELTVHEPSTVKLEIVNEQGTLITTLADNYHARGHFKYPYNAEKLSNGTYICRARIGDLHLTKKFVKLPK